MYWFLPLTEGHPSWKATFLMQKGWPHQSGSTVLVWCGCLFQALNKKEHKGCDSPEPTDGDSYVLTPRTEEKYQKINQEFDLMMQRNSLNSRVSHSHEKIACRWHDTHTTWSQLTLKLIIWSAVCHVCLKKKEKKRFPEMAIESVLLFHFCANCGDKAFVICGLIWFIKYLLCALCEIQSTLPKCQVIYILCEEKIWFFYPLR